MHFACRIALASIARVAVTAIIQATPNLLHPSLLLPLLPHLHPQSGLLPHLRLLRLPFIDHHPSRIIVERPLRPLRFT